MLANAVAQNNILNLQNMLLWLALFWKPMPNAATVKLGAKRLRPVMFNVGLHVRCTALQLGMALTIHMARALLASLSDYRW